MTTFGLSFRRSNLRADQPEGRPCDQHVSPASGDRVKRALRIWQGIDRRL